MSVFRQFYASFLLLCFLRTLLPEAWVLSLHQHQHTSEEPAHISGHSEKALLTAKHQHCQTDHFCNASFQPAPPVELATLLISYQRATTIALICAGKITPPAIDYLRGPPVA